MYKKTRLLTHAKRYFFNQTKKPKLKNSKKAMAFAADIAAADTYRRVHKCVKEPVGRVISPTRPPSRAAKTPTQGLISCQHRIRLSFQLVCLPVHW